MLEKFCALLSRRKSLEYTLKSDSKLQKCLSTFDLVFLGVSCTLGSGVFILIGMVAKTMAGPSILLCFIVAGLASILAGLCYAEFGARVPRAGSAYIYSYVAVGELWAFVIGWNIILEYIISCAATARASSMYIDTLSNGAVSKFFTENARIHLASFSSYPDFIAFGLMLFFSIIICFGMHASSMMNNVFAFINLFVILYAIVCGLFWVDINNWFIPAEKVPPPVSANGVGGFFPFGIGGTLSGAATCFFAFVGFDVIAAAGEESLTAAKSAPKAILLCLLICTISYIVPAIILTTMLPYYELQRNSALPMAFRSVGWPVAEYIISAGAVVSLVSCLLVTSCVMPRIVYAMASDGLLFKFLATVNERFKTPVYATIVSGIATSVFALMVELNDLIEMLSIGTLLAYTLVAVCVIQLRYEPESKDSQEVSSAELRTWRQIVAAVFQPQTKSATRGTFLTIRVCLGLAATFAIWSGMVLLYLHKWLLSGYWWAIILVIVPLFSFVFVILIMSRQPQNTTVLTFQVPWVPLVPAASVFINIYLMLNLQPLTWVRFVVWMAIGFLIYFLYGIHHDTKHIRRESGEVAVMETKKNENYGAVSKTLPVAAKVDEDNAIVEQSDTKHLLNE